MRLGKWGGSYGGNIPSSSINGAYLRKDENQSNLQLFFQPNKQLRINVGSYWFLTKSKYNSHTLPNDILTYNGDSFINDNRSMFVFGLTWNFFSGKRLEVNKKIENRDNDKGTF